jgi:sensor histidine kinase YesM
MQMIVNDCSMILSSVLYTTFVAAYLDIRKHYPKLFPFIVFYITVLTLGMFWYGGVLLMDRFNPIHIGFINYEFLFVTIFSIGMLIYIVAKGVKGTGWVVIIGSIILILGNAVAMLGGNFIYITPFVTIEVILFALGLGYQIRLNDRERLKTREELIEQMQITEKLQLNFQSRLEKEVELQTKKADAMSRAAAIAREEQIHTELLNELEQAKMKALQTQMNPHFIFNCINSIRLFYMKNDLEKADSYITKFSKLIRSILNYSRQENISLKEELKTLALYMDFEQMRFDSKFDYVIQVANELTPAKIRIPSLLLQPFVENAIWHGLMQSDKHGIVRIDVQPLQSKSILITIEDNGIGRTKAKEYSQQNLSKHKSFGLRITKERLDLLKRSQNKTATFEVIDLYDDKKQPRGTKVQIIYDL